jgi:hypothetical protein
MAIFCEECIVNTPFNEEPDTIKKNAREVDWDIPVTLRSKMEEADQNFMLVM